MNSCLTIPENCQKYNTFSFLEYNVSFSLTIDFSRFGHNWSSWPRMEDEICQPPYRGSDGIIFEPLESNPGNMHKRSYSRNCLHLRLSVILWILFMVLVNDDSQFTCNCFSNKMRRNELRSDMTAQASQFCVGNRMHTLVLALSSFRFLFGLLILRARLCFLATERLSVLYWYRCRCSASFPIYFLFLAKLMPWIL